jgi:catechol 2,3-dioxygenase-like lactoylglutathione lyase family enzyme
MFMHTSGKPMILDHIGIGVSDYDRSKAFYLTALKPLDVVLIKESRQQDGVNVACGLGKDGKPDFWLGSEGKTTPPMHVAFRAETRAAVDAFYKNATAAGARDNGPPGLRAHYHPNYYAAFVLDPDGHNIEAVCHKPA